MSERVNDVIDDADIRAAVKPLRPDPAQFAVGVHQRIAAARVRIELPGQRDSSLELDGSSWLRIAAAVIPSPLLCKAGTSSAVKLAQLTFSQKLLALAALPAISLLLMITGTIWAIIKIRKAHRGQDAGSVDAQRAMEVTKSWWRQYGLLSLIVHGAVLALVLTRHVVPVFILFLISGAAMVSFVTRLGKEGLVERNTLAGILGSGLMTLAQLTLMTSAFNHGYPFLDQALITGILLSGALVVFLLCRYPEHPSRRIRRELRIDRVIVLLPALALIAWTFSSLWYPVSTRDIQRYVESFDHAPFSSASWRTWQISAQWLRERHLNVDWSKPKALLRSELQRDEPNGAVLLTALECGLFDSAQLDEIPGLDYAQQRLFDPFNTSRPFLSLHNDSNTCMAVHLLVLKNQLSESDRDFLSERLLATWNELKSPSSHGVLAEQLAITRLAQLIGRPLDMDVHRVFVHTTLEDYQCLDYQYGVQSGGFRSDASLTFSSSIDTAAAIELMQYYGVPNGVRLDALRSYLRPSSLARLGGLRDEDCLRAANRQRLESLSDVPTITLSDYFRYEQNLIMAALLTFVCIFATLGAPALPQRQLTT